MLELPAVDGDGEAFLERLDAELSHGVRLVAVSAVQFQSGYFMPLVAMARRCHDRGAELCVDGVQACGAVPLDLPGLGVDYLSCGSHKWLMGVGGAGFLFVHPSRVAALRPAVAGWLSHEDGLRFLVDGPGLLRYDRPLRTAIDFVEGGNVNGVGLAALEASVDLLLHLVVETIHRHANAYLDLLEPELVGRGFRSLRSPQPARRSCTLGVLPPPGRDVVALHRALLARRISCSIPDGVLRFAPHWPNALDEVPFVLEAVDAALA